MSTSRKPQDLSVTVNKLAKRVSDLEKALSRKDNTRDDIGFVLSGTVFVGPGPIWPVFPRRVLWRIDVRLWVPDSTLSIDFVVDGDVMKTVNMAGRTTLTVPTAIECPSESNAWFDVTDCTGDGSMMTCVGRW